jgi:hypothetical protein
MNSLSTNMKEECEEKLRAEAEVVQATPFQSVISEFESRQHDNKDDMNNWFKNIVMTANIGGRDITRLSVL